MKTIRKGFALLSKITLLALLIALLTPIPYFAWRMGQPLPQPEFKGLTYYQFVEWRNMLHEENIVKYETSHPNVEYKGIGGHRFCDDSLFERTFYPFQAFTYTLAALHGVRPDPLHALPENVTVINFLPKWWDTIEYLFWYNTVHASNFGGSLVEYCRFQPNIPTPEEFESLKSKYEASAIP